jgi:Flp pilus assembly pilin Flp
MKLFQSQKGQGMVEYILIVGLIALMVFVAVKTLGTNIKTGFTNAASKVTDATSW